MSRVVIGIGNSARRDDGVGPAVAARVAARRLPDVRVLCSVAESAALIDAWSGAGLAVLVDAAVGERPGRVRRCSLADLADFADRSALSSHDLGLAQTYALAQALGRAPGTVVVIAVDIADGDHGEGLSPAVAAALAEAEEAVLDALGQGQEARHQEP